MCFYRRRKEQPKIKSGEHYTPEWWWKKSGLGTIRQTAVRLNSLVSLSVVEKVSIDKREIVRFMPTAMFCEYEIVAMLREESISQVVENLHRNAYKK